MAVRRAVEPSSRLVGLIGRAIGLSRSPAMHELEGAHVGIPYSYILIDLDDVALDDAALPDVVAEAEALGFAGLNITHPFKQAIVDHLDDLSPDAAAIGAVNTVLFRDGRRIGHNTDADGFAESFAEELPQVLVRSVTVLGAGGAGAAVGHALLLSNVDNLRLYDIETQKAEALARRLAARFGSRVVAVRSPDEAFDDVDGIVNATPVGMAKYPGLPFPRNLLQPHHWVAEVVYFPAETELVRLARELGCKTLPGIGMAIHQAAKSFELFTGVAPDRRRMFEHFRMST